MRVGVYAGSFNPFHKGHLNIAEKAAALFDRLVIVQGHNPEKEFPRALLADLKLKSLAKFQVETCEGLLTDHIRRRWGSDATLVRGLRNNFDLQAEINQARFYQDLMPDIRIIYILCDRQYEHISSSAIRILQKFGEGRQYLVE
jgi:pantetheine-phosphate adenylyltransferase